MGFGRALSATRADQDEMTTALPSRILFPCGFAIVVERSRTGELAQGHLSVREGPVWARTQSVRGGTWCFAYRADDLGAFFVSTRYRDLETVGECVRITLRSDYGLLAATYATCARGYGTLGTAPAAASLQAYLGDAQHRWIAVGARRGDVTRAVFRGPS